MGVLYFRRVLVLLSYAIAKPKHNRMLRELIACQEAEHKEEVFPLKAMKFGVCWRVVELSLE